MRHLIGVASQPSQLLARLQTVLVFPTHHTQLEVTLMYQSKKLS